MVVISRVTFSSISPPVTLALTVIGPREATCVVGEDVASGLVGTVKVVADSELDASRNASRRASASFRELPMFSADLAAASWNFF